MPTTLQLATTLTLPLDAVTQTFGCIGRKGAGKTYLAGVLAEQMLDQHAQVIVLDPVGNWWGLRVDADGKSRGKAIFVIGGEHGDLPITVDSGAKIARVLVSNSVSAVLDISSFRQGERKRFAADFAEEFFHLKKTQRSAVHLFVEEAQLFVPQRCGPDEARMLGAYENIIRLGRNYGVGATLISQRPQSVNKEVLSQVECLCVLQVNGAHERKALEEWVQEAGADRKLVGELPGLQRGEGYVWSPSWLKVFKRVHFSKKTTFDASATPEVGKTVKQAMLSVVDVDSLKQQLQEIVAKAEQDDPAALRRRVKELERAASKPTAASIDTPAPPVVDPALRKQLDDLSSQVSAVEAKLAGWQRQRAAARKAAEQLVASLADDFDATAAASNLRQLEIKARQSLPLPATVGPRIKPTASAQQPRVRVANNHSYSDHQGSLPQGEQRILSVLAQYQSGLQRPQIGVFSGYCKRSTRDAYLARLQNRGYVEQNGSGIAITDAGLAAVGDYEPLPTGRDLQEWWLAQLPQGEAAILRVLCATPTGLPREVIGELTGYDARSTRDAYIARLGTKMLIEHGNGVVRASKDLFD